MPDSASPQDDEQATPAGEDTPPAEDVATPDDTTVTPAPEDVQPEDATTGSGQEKRIRERVGRGGEETFGKLAQDLLEHPMVTGALSAVFETRERASRAQEVAMSALNLPSASDIERLTRRLRSVSQRLEGLEDGIDDVADRLDRLGQVSDLHARLDTIEAALQRIEAKLGTEPAGE
jgi:hypothetical protein